MKEQEQQMSTTTPNTPTPPTPPTDITNTSITDQNLKFTQEQLNAIASKARDEGRGSETKRILAELGVDDIVKAKEALAAIKELDDKNKSEVQKLAEERDKARLEAETAKNDAFRFLVNAKLEGALRDANINPLRIANALKLANLSGITVENGEVKGIDAIVKEVKDSTPEWFGGKFSPPDAGKDGSSKVNYKELSPDEVSKALNKYNLR